MKKSNGGKLKIIPLGGLEQIGMNITAFEYEDSIIVVDCGLAFPEDDMLGIDLVIPDITYLKDNYEKVKGFVITHGTDTMDETAYFLNLTAKCNKPIVLVGAMRPSNALSADGPANLYNAVAVAGDPSAAGKGVMVVMNDRVLGARDVTKTNTTGVETFQSPNAGQLATIHNGKVLWDAAPVTKHTTQTPFKVDGLDKLPKVGVVYQHAGVEGIQAQALVDAKYDGIVTAGVGNGNLHKSTFPIIEKAAKDGIAIVRSSRVPTGSTTKDAEVDDAKYGFVSSGSLNPQKARVLLMLALTQTKDPKEIQKIFDQY